MSLSLRITILVVLLAATLGAVGCVRLKPSQPWEAADAQVAASARMMADSAQRNDLNYFRGLTVEREKLPDLIEAVARSGIATNYAEHLEVESDSDATLVYRQEGDLVLATPFSVQLSLRDGETRIDQIIIGEYKREASGRLGTLFKPSIPSGITTPPLVSVALASGSLVAGSEQSALVSYVNTSDKNVWVPRPLSSQVIIIDTAGERVSVWGPFRAFDPTGAVKLASFESAYDVVQFTAPAPGSYLVFGRANGTLSPATNFRTTEE